jgi:predicted ferric reductase
MSVASAPSFRNRLYEIFRIIHFGCSTAICVLLWLHIATAKKIYRIQAGICLCVWISTYTHRNLLLLYRNFRIGKPRTRVSIENIHNTLKVNVSLPRPWRVKPGQYVYLTTARSGFFSILQRHPFMIAKSKSKEYDFEMRILPASGFTRRLLGISLGNRTSYLGAFIEGPYGHGFDLRDYGTVVLLASGIGIAGQLPYIQELIRDYRCSETKTRDLLLIWLVENKTHRDLVWEYMTDMLRRDDLPHAQGRHRKSNRSLGNSSTPDSPGYRPTPHGENASSSTHSCHIFMS